MKTKHMMYAALFAALTAAVAWVKIPLGFSPVPITLQTLMVLLSGAMLGARLGALAQILYLAVGALGLPVFAGGAAGIGILMGPTGGFLLSFPIAAFLVGYLVEKKGNWQIISAIIVALLIVFTYVDLLLGLGILSVWGEDDYVSIVSLLDSSQTYILVGVSFAILLLLGGVFLFVAKKKNIKLHLIYAMFSATLVIYLLGALQGYIVTKLPINVILVGWILPFIIGDTIKLLIAASIAGSVKLK